MNLDICTVSNIRKQKFNFPGFLSFSSSVLVHNKHNILVNFREAVLPLGSPEYLYSKQNLFFLFFIFILRGYFIKYLENMYS